MTELTQITFREIPLLMDIEQWIARERGIMWRPEFEQRVEQVSVALFGITRAAAKPPEPRPADFGTWEAFLGAQYAWEQARLPFLIPADAPEEYDEVDFLEDLGIDLWDGEGNLLRCAEWFVEQAIAAVKQIDGAQFTPDGSGSVAAPDAEKWGAALEQSAREFTARKR